MMSCCADRVAATGSNCWDRLVSGDPPERSASLLPVVAGATTSFSVPTDGRPDRILGGAGRDRADGREGQRDLCFAEVTRHCERF